MDIGPRGDRPHPASDVRVLFATNHAYLPYHKGGSEVSTHDLCLTLQECGVEVGVMSALLPRASLSAHRQIPLFLQPRDSFVRDDSVGYPVFRCRQPAHAVETVVESFRPHLVVIQAGRPLALAGRVASLGVPRAIYLRDAYFDDLGGPVVEGVGVRYLATSLDLARRFAEAFGIRPLSIPPVVRPGRYRVESSRKSVTFVCPFSAKGVDIAVGLAARRPDIPFVFVESWQLHPFRRAILHARTRGRSNIVHQRPIEDIRKVYRETRIVLVPSQAAEGWGRVVSEAQLSGIPVLASRIGGLPESVGPGGILVDPLADLDEWEQGLAQMWDDAVEYERLAERARLHAERAEFIPAAIVERLLGVFSDLAGRHST
jgi:glycosyltransferase involved in cell wall biosynthesis